MSEHNSRQTRVADQIQKELAVMLQREIKDPRVGFVTVSGVKVSRDFSFADVYISVLGKNSRADANETFQALQKAAGFLRNQLGRAIQLRMVPQLRFHFDDAMVRGHEMSRLIDSAIAEDSARQQKSSENSDEV